MYCITNILLFQSGSRSRSLETLKLISSVGNLSRVSFTVCIIG